MGTNPNPFVVWNPALRAFVATQPRRQPRGVAHLVGDHWENWTPETLADFIDTPDLPEVARLVHELTAYFGRIGMHSVCRLCFKGLLDRGGERYHIGEVC